MDTANAGISFKEEAEVTLLRLRDAVARLLDASPTPVFRAADIHKAFAIEQPVGWGIFRVATAQDGLSAGVFVPKRSALHRFLESARSCQIPNDIIAEVDAALEALERLVEKRAGDRELFDSMVADLVGDRKSSSDLRHRRTAYRSNVHIYGCYADAWIVFQALRRSRVPEKLDLLLIRGYVNLRSLYDRPFAVDEGLHVFRDSRGATSGLPDNVDLRGGKPVLLTDCCSGDLPTVSSSVSREGTHISEIEFQDVGAAGAATYFTAQYIEAAMSNPVSLTHWFTRPVGQYLFHALMDKGAWQGTLPSCALYSGYQRDGRMIRTRSTLIQSTLDVAEVDPSPASLRTPLVRGYHETIHRMMGELGWNLNEFRAFRVQMDYPPIYASPHLLFDAPLADA